MVPAVIPETIPDDIPTGATAGTVLAHVPPVAPLLSVVVLPWHTVGVPDTGNIALTVNVAEAMQPVPVV